MYKQEMTLPRVHNYSSPITGNPTCELPIMLQNTSAINKVDNG